MPVPDQVRYSGLSLDEAFELCRVKVKELHDDLDRAALVSNDQHVVWVQRTSDEIKALASVCEGYAHELRERQRARR